MVELRGHIKAIVILVSASQRNAIEGNKLRRVGGIGTLRLPDLYTRTHAASITDTLGAGLILLGLALQAGIGLVAVKLVMVYAFMLLTGPAASHALVKAAYAQGLKAAGIADNKAAPGPTEGS